MATLPELIIAIVALRAGPVDMVRASPIGALLANVLLALGVAFLLGGLRHHVQDYNPAAARLYASMMLLVLSSRLIASERLTLSFSRVESGALFLGVLIGTLVAGDGCAHWFKGVQLVAFYLIIAVVFDLIPA